MAAKHGVTVQFLTCARRDRFAVAARAEAAHELTHQLKWSLRRVGEHIGCTHQNVCQLLACHKINQARGLRFMPAADLRALAAVSGDERLARVRDAEERAAYAEGELTRLTGANLALRMADALGLLQRVRCAIVLAIVAEAYPRVVLGAELIEHYDEACERIGYGNRQGANANLITKNVAHLRGHFAANGWPEPLFIKDELTRTLTGARRLSDGAALFLHERFDAPRRSQIEAAQEARSVRVRFATGR